MHRHTLALHFAFCLGVAFIGAAWATDFPYLPSNDQASEYMALIAYERRWLQICALASAGITSLVTAYLLRSSDTLRKGRFVRHFAVLFGLLIVNHFLWVEPIWGFRHDYTLGIFAWLVLSFEESNIIFPNPIGLIMTFFPYLALHREFAPWAMGSGGPEAGDECSQT